jgi:TrmH family RNA methyltransferase
VFGGQRKNEPLVLVLAGLQDPGNLGTILRSAEAFGADGILCLPGAVSAWNPKAVRASAGSVFRLPLLMVSERACFDRLREAGVKIFAASAHGAQPAGLVDLAGAVALLIGNEGNGVPKDLAAMADGAITIPCPGPVESLNAAVATSVLLYEASRQRAVASNGPVDRLRSKR